MNQLKPFSFSKRFPDVPMIAAAFAGSNQHMVPLAFGLPAEESFNLELMKTSSVAALSEGGVHPLEYSGGNGPKVVTEWISKRSALRSIHVEKDQVLVTAGSMQAIDIATRALTDPLDHVWIESPTFFAAIRQFLMADTVLTSFPVDEEGLVVDKVEEKLIEAVENNLPLPKLFYVMPNYHNPTGVSLSLERRKKLAALAYEYNFFVIEDDAYVELSFSHEYIPSIYSFGPERVIYISTFSKIVAPGIRMGWAIADKEVLNKMQLLKSDGMTNVYVQEIVSKYLTSVDFESHLDSLISMYENRMTAMTEAINEYFDEEVTFVKPEGGFFLWITFPNHVSTSKLLEYAMKQGVSYLDGALFYLHGEEKNHLRLGFTYCNEKNIKEGIKRLATAYKAYKSSDLVVVDM